MLNPLDHLGLIAIALQRWRHMRRQSHWQDSEEWGEACLGLVNGCRTYRPDRGCAPSTWLVLHMRSRLKALHGARARHRRRLDVATLRASLQPEGWRDRHPGELRDWLEGMVNQLPWPQRGVMRRILAGESRKTIAWAMRISLYEADYLRLKGLAELRARINAE